MDRITLNQGFGGKDSNELISNVIFKTLYSDINSNIINGNDAAIVDNNIAISTDSFVVSPIFFTGGNIGKLCVAGTVNDILTAGAVPKYLTLAFIIEEGFLLSDLEEILLSIRKEAIKNNVEVITGDTKVLPKGLCDGIYINTTGIGYIKKTYNPKNIKVGDKIIISGTVGDHEAALTLIREKFPFDADIASDCSGLAPLLVPLISDDYNIKAMRDPTRGGLAATLNELTVQCGNSFTLYEDKLPIKDEVRGFCEITGFDLLSFASEGKMIIFADKDSADSVVKELKKHELGQNACVIGEVTEEENSLVLLKTIAGKRIIPMPNFSQLPRIC